MANNITKEQIRKAAEAFNSSEKENALRKMEEAFYSILEESLREAETKGISTHYRRKYIHLPEFFKGVVPEEFKEKIKEAGFSCEIKEGDIILI